MGANLAKREFNSDAVGATPASLLTIASGRAAPIQVELFDNLAPGICGELVRVIPVTTTLAHAKFAGAEVFAMVPFYAEAENPKLDVVAGDVAYYPGRQTICMFYGDTQPFGEVSLIGHVRDQDLPALAELGRILLDEGWVRIVFQPAGS